jgi:hypothetical protein
MRPKDPMAKWRDLVGGFILAFGQIELITFRLWRDHCQGEPSHNFTVRTGAVIAALRRDERNHTELVALLERSLQLAGKRNTIAHHPMQVQVFRHSESGEVVLEQAIASEINDDYIDDGELRELRSDVERLAKALITSVLTRGIRR